MVTEKTLFSRGFGLGAFAVLVIVRQSAGGVLKDAAKGRFLIGGKVIENSM